MSSTGYPRIILHPGKERSLLQKHPWLFSGAIQKMEGQPVEGDIVEVYSSRNDYLATGHYHEGSIKVRIFSFSKTDASEDFWREKINSAFNFRLRAGIADQEGTNVYRLVHAEGDGLPGLIIDFYAGTAVIQTHTVGMHKAKDHIVKALFSVLGSRLSAVYDKSSETMQRQTAQSFENKYLEGTSLPGIVSENGIQFHVDWETGQKTGFFIDQRENRKLLASYTRGKKVLNTFSYSGGFSMYALRSGASVVHSVDSSKKAAEWATKNSELNGFSDRHTFYMEDVFDFFKRTEDSYDVMVLDPPAFAKHLSSVAKATIGYRNLNTEGIRRIAPGGILFTFSCSQVIDKELFRKIVFQSALQARREVRILHQLSQAPDHPVSIYHPEGEYLKGLVLYVE